MKFEQEYKRLMKEGLAWSRGEFEREFPGQQHPYEPARDPWAAEVRVGEEDGQEIDRHKNQLQVRLKELLSLKEQADTMIDNGRNQHDIENFLKKHISRERYHYDQQGHSDYSLYSVLEEFIEELQSKLKVN